MLRQVYDESSRSEAVERACSALRAAPLVGRLARDREAVGDALAWCGWVLAGGVVLFASWELGGFAVLVGQEAPDPPALHQTADTASAQAEDGGCTQASLDRVTRKTTAATCQQALRSQ